MDESNIFDGNTIQPEFAKALLEFIQRYAGPSNVPGNFQAGGIINAVGGFKVGGTAGVTASITLEKLTSGGSNGALTIKDGIITAASQPS